MNHAGMPSNFTDLWPETPLAGLWYAALILLDSAGHPARYPVGILGESIANLDQVSDKRSSENGLRSSLKRSMVSSLRARPE